MSQTVVSQEDFQNKISFMTQNLLDENYESLGDTEIEDLLTMTSDVLMKIKQQTGK